MIEKRFHYDWKTGRFKDTQSDFCATSDMRVLETLINDACYSYEKKIKELEKEKKELKNDLDFCQRNIHNIGMESRELAIREMRKALDKMERFE